MSFLFSFIDNQTTVYPTVDLHEDITIFPASTGNKYRGFGAYSDGLWSVTIQSKFTFLPLQID